MFIIDSGARHLLDILNGAGYRAYIVGGCVRDLLRGVPVGDWDICTSALPSQTKEIFTGLGYRVISVGEAHGTQAVMYNGILYEITTFRTDGSYTDGRHPDSVSFCFDIVQDLSRRDFTVNAMAYHPVDGLADPFGGRGDLAEGIIRAVGDPVVRFGEDALRMMRAVRFCAVTGFALENITLEGIKKCAHLIQQVSAERIRVELIKMVRADILVGMTLFYSTGLMKYVLPELTILYEDERGKTVIESAVRLPDNEIFRLAMLFSVCDEQTVRSAVTRLKFSSDDIRDIVLYSGLINAVVNNTPIAVKQFLRKYGLNAINTWLIMQDALSRRRDDIHLTLGTVLREAQPYELTHLAINGNDLVSAGISGRAVGDALERCLDFAIEYPLKNDRDTLVKIALHG